MQVTARNMHRDIRVRAWDKNRKCWLTAEELNLYGQGISIEIEAKRAGVVLMQYVGIRDKNGKDVCEGDIVRIANYKNEWKRGEPMFDWRVFAIEWNQYVWAFNNSVIYMPLSTYDKETLGQYDIEILGNVYENPELLI